MCKPLLIALAAFVFSSSTWAQSLADICATVELPTMAEYEGNAGAYADNFCALAAYAPQRAASQLNKTISLVRATNNPNRFYWDPKIEPTAEYIQLLRPWMAEQGGWQIHRLRYGLANNDNRQEAANRGAKDVTCRGPYRRSGAAEGDRGTFPRRAG